MLKVVCIFYKEKKTSHAFNVCLINHGIKDNSGKQENKNKKFTTKRFT